MYSCRSRSRSTISAYRDNLIAQLENTYIVEPDGTKHKLGKRPD